MHACGRSVGKGRNLLFSLICFALPALSDTAKWTQQTALRWRLVRTPNNMSCADFRVFVHLFVQPTGSSAHQAAITIALKRNSLTNENGRCIVSGSSQATRTRTLFIRRIPFSLDWAVLEFLFRHRIGLSTAPGVAAMGFDPDSASRPLPSSYSVHIPAEAPTSARASMRRGVEVHVVSTGGADRAATGRDGLRPITLPTGGAWAKGSSASAIR